MIGGSYFISQQIYEETQSIDTEILNYNYNLLMKNLDMIDIC